jgi:hypothetical protein
MYLDIKHSPANQRLAGEYFFTVCLQYLHHFGEGLDKVSSALSFREWIFGFANPDLVNARVDSTLDIGVP